MNLYFFEMSSYFFFILQLRLSFYDNIIGVAAFVGQQCSPILLPLLQQGLSDSEEFVIAKSINTMASLTGKLDTYIHFFAEMLICIRQRLILKGSLI